MAKFTWQRIIYLLIAVLTFAIAGAQHEPQTLKDIPFAHVDNKDLLLDLYMPAGVEKPPLVVWIHGGAWSRGSKDSARMEFVDSGFALASIGYRLSGEARFPAQIHDIKASIRFLRAMAPKFGYRKEQIAISGSSAGGHLAALVGTTNDHAELEGRVGGYFDQSSSIQAIVDYYGPTNLNSILAQSTPHGLSVRVPALELLLGGKPPETVSKLAELASPVAHVDANDPPLLMLHGDQDPQVPINQSHELQGAYEKAGLTVHFKVVHGGAHGGKAFVDTKNMERVRAFLTHTIGK